MDDADTQHIGLVGLGTMGAALALNMAEKGASVVVYNRSGDVTSAFMADAGALADRLTPADSPAALFAALAPPRAIVLMVTAGAAVDAVIEGLLPHLDRGDAIIDGGNADFHDTRRRESALTEKGIAFLGMGVSGGEEGARHGPSIMVGGSAGAYDRIAPVLEAIAARYKDDPCVAHLGSDGAGHFVKTVHNGIEYADMQLIAEIYGILRYCQGRGVDDIAELFEAWNFGPLQSYLVEITAKILRAVDPLTGGPVVDVIVDSAGQKGTGRWTLIEALRLGQSASTIEAAVGARSWSALRAARTAGAGLFPADGMRCHPLLDTDLEAAFLAARIVAYGQGFQLLRAASDEYGWNINLPRVAEIWRAGCIIRSALLDEIAHALRDDPTEGLVIFSPVLAARLTESLPALRRVASSALAGGVPAPALASALGYFDTMRTARGTTDLIQAQRDFFGAHGFERLDGGEGRHGPWHGPKAGA
jgi:6-phosphogluconate dehydrogenase